LADCIVVAARARQALHDGRGAQARSPKLADFGALVQQYTLVGKFRNAFLDTYIFRE
jgi:hypothetical protein